ncbi:MAG: DEAD/DEAH box helicase [Anaerolineaceae bacterium]
MLDFFSRELMLQARTPSMVTPDEASLLMGNTYIAYIAKKFFNFPIDIDTTLEAYDLARLSLATSIKQEDENDIPSSLFIAESSDIPRQIIEPPKNILQDYHQNIQKIDRAYFFHLADYDANANLLAKHVCDFLNSLKNSELNEITMAEISYYKCLAYYLQGKMGKCKEEAETRIDETCTKDKVFIFIRDYLSTLSQYFGGKSTPTDDFQTIILHLSHVLKNSIGYSKLDNEVDRIINLTRVSKRKALYPMLVDIFQNQGDYLRSRIASTNNEGYPFAWPPVREFCDKYFSQNSRHAVISIPTGGGKSFLAELAVVKAIQDGWILYLAPTNALCFQIRKDLAESLTNVDRRNIQVFAGGFEYITELEYFEAEQNGVYVMTPEKASLLQKLYPDRFTTCSLVVLDECHLLGEKERGAVAEAVITGCLVQNPEIRVILMSALVENIDIFVNWLESKTTGKAAKITTQWRPTRSGRITVAQDFETLQKIEKGYQVGVRAFADLVTPWQHDDNLYSWPTSILLTSKNRKFPWVNEVSAQLAKIFGNNGLRTLIIVIRNKYHPFTIARQIKFEKDHVLKEKQIEFDWFEIANYELGIQSIVQKLINENRVSVHTALLLECERRASESAFQSGRAKIICATSTLSQGLNLEADTVIVAGTSYYENDEENDDNNNSERSLMNVLNGCGRAARAKIACRGFSVIIPDFGNTIRNEISKERIMSQIPVLGRNENSFEIHSQIGDDLRQLLNTPPEFPLSDIEEKLLKQLPFNSDLRTESLKKLLASEQFSDGEIINFIQRLDLAQRLAIENGYQEWILKAANLGSSNLLIAENIFKRIISVSHLDGFLPPEDSYLGWGLFLINLLEIQPIKFVWELMKNHIIVWRWYWGKNADPNYVDLVETGQLDLENPSAEFSRSLKEIWNNIEQVYTGWINGLPFVELGQTLIRKEVDKRIQIERSSSGYLIPRSMNWQFKVADCLSMFAGLLSAIRDEWVKNEPETIPDWFRNSTVLQSLPMGIRFGVKNPIALVWYRNVIRERRSANLLSSLSPIEIHNPYSQTEIRQYLNSSKEFFIQDETLDEKFPILRILRRQL